MQIHSTFRSKFQFSKSIIHPNKVEENGTGKLKSIYYVFYTLRKIQYFGKMFYNNISGKWILSKLYNVLRNLGFYRTSNFVFYVRFFRFYTKIGYIGRIERATGANHLFYSNLLKNFNLTFLTYFTSTLIFWKQNQYFHMVYGI